jgi:hypothetical protein
MLIRRSWVKAVFAVLAGSGVSGGLVADHAEAQEGFGNNFANSIDSMHLVKLEDQLRYGLRCARPGQIEYVRLVSRAVDEGRLPRGMVNLVYRWATQRDTNVPFPYFQFALEELARRRGISISGI